MASESNKIGVKSFGYFLAGAGVGAVISLLFARKAGKELRAEISDATKRSIDYAQKNVQMIGEKTSGAIHNVSEKAKEFVTTEKNNLLNRQQAISSALEAGKEAYRAKRAGA